MNKQKTDWEKTFDKTFLNIRFNTTVGTSVNIKDFISNLLQQQKTEIIKEIEGIVGGDTGGTGQVYFYKKQLRKEIRERLNQI